MSINIHGKDYITVAERLITFHKKYPNSKIETVVDYPDTETVRCKATVWPDTDNQFRCFTGHAEENRKATMINKTSAVENCETSAVGRALAMLGISIDKGIASAEEIQIAKNKELAGKEKSEKPTKQQLDEIERLRNEANLTVADLSKGVRTHYGISYTALTSTQADGVITMLKKKMEKGVKV